MFAPIKHFALVEIGEDGTPAEDLGRLSEFASDACAQTAAHYKRTGFSRPWISFLARVGSEIVGVCALTAALIGGRAEIAYHTFPPFGPRVCYRDGEGAAHACDSIRSGLRAFRPYFG